METKIEDPTKEFIPAEHKEQSAEIFKDTQITAGDLLNLKITPRAKLAGEWCRGGDIGFVFGVRGKGKTFFSISLACALACGVKLHKWKIPQPHKVCYVDGEMTLENIQQRIRLFSESSIFKDCAERLKANLYLQHYEHISEIIEDAFLNLTDTEQQGKLFNYCLENGIEVLFLDNLSCLFRGMKENDADEWEKVLPFLLNCRRNKISVVIVHHAGKNGETMRGTSKREDAIDWAISIKDSGSPEPQEADSGAKEVNAMVSFTKNREGTNEDIEPFGFRCLTAHDKMEISFCQMSMQDRFLELVQNGVNRCRDIAEELGISKGQVSKLASRYAAMGLLKKKKYMYEIPS